MPTCEMHVRMRYVCICMRPAGHAPCASAISIIIIIILYSRSHALCARAQSSHDHARVRASRTYACAYVRTKRILRILLCTCICTMHMYVRTYVRTYIRDIDINHDHSAAIA